MGVIQRMLARPEYLFPLVAAEKQFRQHYYGLNAGALLEDLFVDALTNYVRQHEPDISLSRAATGQKDWDYELGGTTLSHKVRSGSGDIGAIWDATIEMDTWSADAAFLVVVSGFSPSRIGLVKNNESGNVQSVGHKGAFRSGRSLCVVRWPDRSRELEMVETAPIGADHRQVWDAIPFEDLWRHIAGERRDGEPVNVLDVFISGRSGFVPAGGGWQVDESVVRPGAYLIPRSRLQDLDVKRNNRAVLVPNATIVALLKRSATDGLVAPMSLWYQAYAASHPPDLYTAQRTEYDALFNKEGYRPPD